MIFLESLFIKTCGKLLPFNLTLRIKECIVHFTENSISFILICSPLGQLSSSTLRQPITKKSEDKSVGAGILLAQPITRPSSSSPFAYISELEFCSTAVTILYWQSTAGVCASWTWLDINKDIRTTWRSGYPTKSGGSWSVATTTIRTNSQGLETLDYSQL